MDNSLVTVIVLDL